jgi:hypothetical protein
MVKILIRVPVDKYDKPDRQSSNSNCLREEFILNFQSRCCFNSLQDFEDIVKTWHCLCAFITYKLELFLCMRMLCCVMVDENKVGRKIVWIVACWRYYIARLIFLYCVIFHAVKDLKICVNPVCVYIPLSNAVLQAYRNIYMGHTWQT